MEMDIKNLSDRLLEQQIADQEKKVKAGADDKFLKDLKIEKIRRMKK